MERTNVKGVAMQQVILTAGMINAATGKQIFGVFATEEDARSINADELAIATVGACDLTAEQIELAERNSEAL